MIFRVAAITFLSLTALGGCGGTAQTDPPAAQAVVDSALLLSLNPAAPSFKDDVQPILDRRCVVCHGCFDAPCQLKLSSWEGLQRGANEEKVYDGARIRAMRPTRLFIDAKSTAEWRRRDFYAVLNEGPPGIEANLQGSLLYRMLRLKQLHPQPAAGRLPDDFDLGLDRAQVCTPLDRFDRFAADHPLWGMPYAMPNLPLAEYDLLVSWIAQGAPGPGSERPSRDAQAEIAAWESFLNGTEPKARLMSRYLYEHLFLGHIRLAGTGPREFYRLVRSRTPPGEPVDEIATVRPFDDPGVADFHYRLTLYRPSIVAKAHVVYEFSPGRRERYRELFLDPDYVVTTLPAYDPRLAANPFKAFASIPPASRYRFMLDDARFFIEGFIKGPVCRGQVALNVIDDQFWVFFFDPDQGVFTTQAEFLDEVADDLAVPADRGNTLNVLAIWTDYWRKQKKYLESKQSHFMQLEPRDIRRAVEYVWDGDGQNPNAALTVFRNFDSAAVINGLHGNFPETAWIIDYPLFERIHYLLVAGFDVYGNVGHQLNSRLYMDFLRMEGEHYFLAFLPAAQRKAIRDSWYVGIRAGRDYLFKEPIDWLGEEFAIGYRSDDPQRELYDYLLTRTAPVAGPDDLNRCTEPACLAGDDPTAAARVERSLRRIARLRGPLLQIFPDTTFLRIRNDVDGSGDLAYTLLLNKGYKNLMSMFEPEDLRDPDDDTLTLLRGLVGAYPNFFLVVDASAIEAFTADYLDVRSAEDYDRFVQRFGVRRTHPAFWQQADWFQARYLRDDPVEAGLFDLNRYENR
jgi:hypothetical protein